MEEDVTHIRAALELLRVPRPKQRRTHSWIKGHLETSAGGMCIMGALIHAGADSWDVQLGGCADARAIIKVIREHYPEYHPWKVEAMDCIPKFNDATRRTFEEVEPILEKAAVLREEEGAKTVWTLS